MKNVCTGKQDGVGGGKGVCVVKYTQQDKPVSLEM